MSTKFKIMVSLLFFFVLHEVAVDPLQLKQKEFFFKSQESVLYLNT